MATPANATMRPKTLRRPRVAMAGPAAVRRVMPGPDAAASVGSGVATARATLAVDPLHDRCDALAHPDAHRGKPVAAAGP
jgi:hypothetical protein